MQPANIAVALRRRSPWEAIDLGLTMLQRWWRQVYAPLVLVAAPLIAVSFGIAWYFERIWLAIVLVWWLKPVYDRVVLHVLSRAVFGELPRTGAVLGAWREWLGTGVLASLLPPFRLDWARSFNLAVRQLEGQRGKAARQRRALLGRRARGYAVWLGVVCVHFEWMVLYPSFGLLLALLLPAKAAEGQSFWDVLTGGSADEAAALWSYGDALAYAATVLLLEPFYVAAGFALYLNRRTLLEGWDIEVALRRIAERHAIVGILILSFGLAVLTPAEAQTAKSPQTEIKEVLKAPEFGHYTERSRWQWKPPDWLDGLFSDRRKPEKGSDWGGIGYALAKAAEFALWIAAGAALAYAIWFIARMLPRERWARPEPYRAPAALFGMSLAPETLPPDLPAAAAALAREGKSREALGLLYRGALSTLVHQRGVQLQASHTELEVLRFSLQQLHGASGDYFQNLVKVWRESAYADRHASAAEIERLAQDYPAAFA